MGRSLIALTAMTLIAGEASAADLPRKAPAYAPPAPPPVTWTGCYIGANVGGVWSQGDANFAFGTARSNDNSGFAGGGQIGCDYQFSGGWVIGIRNMFDGTTLSRDRNLFDPNTGATGTLNFKTQWFDTLTGRVGYAFAPAWLIYGQGGVAWAQAKADLTFDGVTFGNLSNTRTGWTAGGGVEWMFAPNWSAFLEGNYMDFGNNDHSVVTPLACPAGCAFSTHAKAATVLVGVNYRFNWGKAPYQ
jgi:outer membrane immunogenic protein